MPTARPTAAVTALLAAGLAFAAVPANAEPLTCQGQAVTVTGDIGTAGDDVMVVGSTATGTASSGAGNDLVCIRVTSSREPLTYGVDAGPGDDRVFNESTDLNTRLSVVLGSGADTYLGSDVTGELVVGGASAWGRAGDTSDVEADVIDTRGGSDAVYSGSVDPGTRNQDRITLGDGDDSLHWAGELVGAAVDLGAGNNSLALYAGWQADDLHIDATTSTVSADARPVLRWTGAVRTYLLRVDTLRTRFTGTDADESLRYAIAHPETPGSAILPDPARRLDADMGGGDDSITEWDFVGGSLVGGPGDDALQAGTCLEADVRLGETFSCLARVQPARGVHLDTRCVGGDPGSGRTRERGGHDRPGPRDRLGIARTGPGQGWRRLAGGIGLTEPDEDAVDGGARRRSRQRHGLRWLRPRQADRRLRQGQDRRELRGRPADRRARRRPAHRRQGARRGPRRTRP